MVVPPQSIGCPPFEADSDLNFLAMSWSSGGDWALATEKDDEMTPTKANIKEALNFIRVTFRSNHLTPTPRQEFLSQYPALTKDSGYVGWRQIGQRSTFPCLVRNPTLANFLATNPPSRAANAVTM